MTDITGAQITAFTNGGAANNGEDVFMSIRVNQGQSQETEMTFFIAADRIGEMIAVLSVFAGMARNTRLSINPLAEADGQFAGAHALPLIKAFGGRSVTASDTSVLTLQFAAPGDRTMNIWVAAQHEALVSLRDTCDRAIRDLSSSESSTKPLN